MQPLVLNPLQSPRQASVPPVKPPGTEPQSLPLRSDPSQTSPLSLAPLPQTGPLPPCPPPPVLELPPPPVFWPPAPPPPQLVQAPPVPLPATPAPPELPPPCPELDASGQQGPPPAPPEEVAASPPLPPLKRPWVSTLQACKAQAPSASKAGSTMVPVRRCVFTIVFLPFRSYLSSNRCVEEHLGHSFVYNILTLLSILLPCQIQRKAPWSFQIYWISIGACIGFRTSSACCGSPWPPSWPGRIGVACWLLTT